MSIIETEIWEPSEDKKGTVSYVGQRKIGEIFDELCEFLKKENIYPDEYFLLNSELKRDAHIPKIQDVICYAQWGGSEGVYLEVRLVVEKNDKQYIMIKFATGKTLGETSADYDRMQYIAGRIYKAFTSEGYPNKGE